MTGRRRWAAPIAAFIAAVFVLQGAAGAQVPAPISGWASANLEWVTTVPIVAVNPGPTVPVGTAGYHGPHAEIHDDHLFLLSDGVLIYDVSDPLEPELVSYIPRPGPQDWPFQNQIGAFMLYGRFATNGKVLVLPGWDDNHALVTAAAKGELPTRASLYVYDIRDKGAPRRIAKLDMTEKNRIHRPFCLFGCRWLYDGSGTIVDLRDIKRPRFAGKWTSGLRFNGASFTVGPAVPEMKELRPGRLLVGSHPMLVLDARDDPRDPKAVARTDGSPYSRGDIDWPGFPNGNLVLSDNVGGLDGKERCESDRETVDDSAFATWDASQWRRTAFLGRIDEYRLKNGTYNDGDPVLSGSNRTHAYGCLLHGFDVNPASTGAGPLVAIAAAGHGLKLLRVGSDGVIEQTGFFLAHGADATDAIWRTNDILYVLDGHRGIDILRYSRSR